MDRIARSLVVAVLLAGVAVPARAADPSGCQQVLSEGKVECEFTYTGGPVRIAGAVAGAGVGEHTVGGQPVPAPNYAVIRVDLLAPTHVNGSYGVIASCTAISCTAVSLRQLPIGTPLLCAGTVIFRPYAQTGPTAAVAAFGCLSQG